MSTTNVTCSEFEVLLADYIDGALRADQLEPFEAHRAACAACAQFAADVQGAAAFVSRVEHVEPPPELLTRISFHIPAAAEAAAPKGAAGMLRNWRRVLFGWLTPVLQPRFAMGMAMTVLSFSMLARFAGIEVRQLRPADLHPAAVWSTIDNRAHRTWTQMVKYYENLRLVYEVQTRLQEWTEQDEAEDRKAQQASPSSPDTTEGQRDGKDNKGTTK